MLCYTMLTIDCKLTNIKKMAKFCFTNVRCLTTIYIYLLYAFIYFVWSSHPVFVCCCCIQFRLFTVPVTCNVHWIWTYIVSLWWVSLLNNNSCTPIDIEFYFFFLFWILFTECIYIYMCVFPFLNKEFSCESYFCSLIITLCVFVCSFVHQKGEQHIYTNATRLLLLCYCFLLRVTF